MPEIVRQRRDPDAPTEGRIQDEIRIDLGREPDLVLWRLSNGAFMALGANGSTTMVQAGIKGMADLLGVLRMEVTLNGVALSLGRLFCLEVKRPGELPRALAKLEELETQGRLTKAAQHELDQQRKAMIVRSKGGFFAFVTSKTEGRAALYRARQGEVQ